MSAEPEPLAAAPPIRRGSMVYRRLPRARPPRDGTKGWRLAAILRRFLLTAIVLAQTAVATWYMLAVLPYHGSTWLEKALTATFAINFGWVSLGAWLALAGLLVTLCGGDRKGLAARTDATALATAELAPTAILMPIYHEPVARTLAGLAAVYRSLEATGELAHFQFFILSDSRDPDIWLAEQAAWLKLVRELGAQGRIHYRRRHVNTKHKSGNIADFMRRWGRRFRYALILDADSLMDGDTVVRMVRLMQCNRQVGILQSPPTIVAAHSPLARIQQFANRLYGPLFSAGLASVQLGDSAYWGHNAMLRTEPFMRHCAIAGLRGVGLFRGAVMSHDFVEAAYMRRGGYEVWLEPGLRGSYEEAPPTLPDELARDRRWSKGNLQHIAIMLRGRRLAMAHRLTFLNGVLAYAAAPVWLAFLVLSAIEVARFTLYPIDYFPDGAQLVPLWPEWHPEWAIRLVASTALVLFLPKVLAFVIALFRPTLRRGFGGSLRLGLGTLLETLASVFLAPVRMLAHSRFVVEALFNLKVRWAGQNRSGELGWWTALRMHGFGMLLGAAWSWYAWQLKPLFFWWSLPVTIPLVVAPAVSVMLARHRLGGWLGRVGLLLTPEDRQRPAVLEARDAFLKRLAGFDADNGFERSLRDADWNRAARLCGNRRALPSELVDKCLAEGVDALDQRERSLLAGNRAALTRLHTALQETADMPAWADQHRA